MHDLSKTILRHGVPLSIHKLPIYLICPHTLFFSSILRLPILQLFLCHIHLCPHHATHTVSPAMCMHSYDCGLPAGIYPHNHKPHCRGVAIVQQPSWTSRSREARLWRASLLVNTYFKFKISWRTETPLNSNYLLATSLCMFTSSDS